MRNLELYGQISAVERILTSLVSAGADRQEAHEWLRTASVSASVGAARGNDKALRELLYADEKIGLYLDEEQIGALLSIESYTGTAAERAQSLVKRIRYRISPHSID